MPISIAERRGGGVAYRLPLLALLILLALAACPRPALAETETGTWGTCPYSYDTVTKVMVLGAGTPKRGTYDSSKPNYTQKYASTMPHHEEVVEVRCTGTITMPIDSDVMFGNCTNLRKIDTSTWDMSTARLTNTMFVGCSSLSDIDVTGFDMSHVSDIGGMFMGCSSLKSLDVSKWDLSGCRFVMSVFSDCKNLGNVDVSGWDMSKVTNMSYAFRNCTSMNSIDISSWDTTGARDTTGATIMNSMFVGDTNLRTITTGAKFKQPTSNPATLPRDMVEDKTTGRSNGFVLEDGVHTYEVISYQDNISHWLMGFNHGEGQNTGGTGWRLSDTHFKAEYGQTVTLDSSLEVKAPNGCVAYGRAGSPSLTSDGSWTSGEKPWKVTQPAKTVYFEYYYQPVTYSITYDLAGGNNANSNPSTYKVLYGVTLADPARTGYTFAGWYDDSGNKVTGINEGCNATFSSTDDLYAQLAKRQTGNVHLTARWSPVLEDRSVTVPSEAEVEVMPDGTLRYSGSLTVTNNSPYAVTLQGTLSQDDGTAVKVTADGLASGDVASGGTRAVTVAPALASKPVATADTQAAHIDWVWVPVA